MGIFIQRAWGAGMLCAWKTKLAVDECPMEERGVSGHVMAAVAKRGTRRVVGCVLLGD